MLKVNHLNIVYNQNIVFKDASIEVPNGSLTLITGESGAGKTTFLNALAKLDNACYYWDDKELTDKESFLFNHVSIVKQIPSFIDKLTINDHIEMIKELYCLKEIDSRWTKLIQIEDLLSLFPKQLSGGERTRVALYLALLKQPDILVLDEPTSALDKDNKLKVIEVLKEYASSGHIVIASSHDRSLIEKADVVYEIKDSLIQNRKSQTFETESQKQNLTKGTISFYRYSRKVKKNQTLYTKIVQFILAISIGFTVFSFSINNYLVDSLNTELNKVNNNQLIVYKPIHESKNYSFWGSEEGMSEDDYNKISSIQGIDLVSIRYDHFLDGYFSFNLDENTEQINTGIKENDTEIDFRLTAFHENKVFHESNVSEAQIFIYLYEDEIDYSSKMIKTYGQQGVYISDGLFFYLYRDRLLPSDIEELSFSQIIEKIDVINPMIEFDFPVPIYNSDQVASSYVVLKDKEERIPCNYIVYDYKKIKVPIRGVINGRTLGSEDIAQVNSLYFSSSEFMTLFNEFDILYPDERECCYIMQEQRYYYDVKEGQFNYTSGDYVTNQTKWTPNGFSVYINDLSKQKSIINELINLGYAVDSEYQNVSNMLSITKSSKTLFIIVGVVLSILFLVFNAYLKLLDEKDQRTSLDYLDSLGLSIKERKQWINSLYFANFVSVYLLSNFSFLGLRFIVESLQIAFIKPKLIIFITLFLLSLSIEYVLPFIISKVKINDRT